MNTETLRKYILPPGPILSLTLIGTLLLGGVLYYRATRIQRFLEPAIAISEPRIQFAIGIGRILKKELGEGEIKDVRFTMDTISVGNSLISGFTENGKPSPAVLAQLSKVFLEILKDPQISSYIDFIIVRVKPPLSQNHEENRLLRLKSQHEAERVLDTLFASEPELKNYALYFAATSMPESRRGGEDGRLEFQIIPTVQIHIDFLMRLEKYVK